MTGIPAEDPRHSSRFPSAIGDGREPCVRFSSRALIVDGRDRVLLAQHATADGSVWVGPGGGVEEGESLVEALARELREEAGLTIRSSADPTLVWIQRHHFGFGEWTSIQNHFFLLRADDLESLPEDVATSFPADPGLLAMRWWSRDDIERSAADPDVVFSPRAFARLWADLLDTSAGVLEGRSPIRLGE